MRTNSKIQISKSRRLMNNQEHGSKERKIWFPAKRYGWGWGLPICWQGWVVMGLWVAALAGGQILFVLFAPKHLGWFVLYVLGLIIVLATIMFLKGEKPGWRWGGK